MGGGGCSRIVGSGPGQMTGETVYETEDGRRWTSDVARQVSGLTILSGAIVGYLHGDRICQHPEEETDP
jgi:hypothetical protein